MRNTLAGSNLSPSAVHAVIEIGISPGLHAQELSAILRLDKSNTSRQIAKLESAGLVERRPASSDGRSWKLYLTRAGNALRAKIDRFATGQVSNALRRLTFTDQKNLIRSLSLYAQALAHENDGQEAPEAIIKGEIQSGYRPGCIGDIASLHARFYAQAVGFGQFFEKKVATEVAEFSATLHSQDRALWLYVDDGRTLASIAIDGDANTGLAHLRWFIVDESLHGMGIGKQLLAHAMDFVDERFKSTYLWTFKGLDAARHLYESSGFELSEEAAGAQWGTPVVEQRFERRSIQNFAKKTAPEDAAQAR